MEKIKYDELLKEIKIDYDYYTQVINEIMKTYTESLDTIMEQLQLELNQQEQLPDQSLEKYLFKFLILIPVLYEIFSIEQAVSVSSKKFFSLLISKLSFGWQFGQTSPELTKKHPHLLHLLNCIFDLHSSN